MELTTNNTSKFKLQQSELFTRKFSSLVPDGIRKTFVQHNDFLEERETLIKTINFKPASPELNFKTVFTPQLDLPIVKAVAEASSEFILSNKIQTRKSKFHVLR